MVVAVLTVLLLSHQVVRGTTPGKRFARLRIARVNGRRLAKWRLAARSVLQFIPLMEFATTVWVNVTPRLFEALVVVFVLSAAEHLWALTNRNRRTLHDLLLGTWVLDKR